MNESVYDRINQVLTWKRIAAFNFVLFLVLIIPLSVRLSQQNTELRSNAATEEAIAKSPIPLPSYPKAPPTIDRVNTFYGKTGDTVVVIGNNFGDYQWDSSVYVGNIQAQAKDIVRWSNSILEVQIPEGAKTGKVWVAVNGNESVWEGSLLLYDVARAAKIGFRTIDSTHASIIMEKANGASRGMMEISYVSEPINLTPSGFVTITNQAPTVDVLGKKMKIEFEIVQPLPRSSVEVFGLEHPEVGDVEITRAELYDPQGNLIELFSDPLSIKIFAN